MPDQDIALAAITVPGVDAPLMAADPDHVALKPMCDALGIDAWSQQRKLNGKSWATTSIMTVVAADGRSREMYMVDRRTMTMWLATIDESRVSPESRPKLISYQAEAADALDAHFNRGRSITQPVNQLDVLRAALDQIEAAQQEASEARAIAAKTDARLDAIEGRHDWYAALGFARKAGIKNTSSQALNKLGRQASLIAKAHGIEPVKVPHALYGAVNSLPLWVWETAAEGRDLN